MVGEKAATVGWKSDLFGRCYAVLIVIVLENVILQCLWVPLEMNSRFRRKTQRQILLLVSWRHVGVHPDGHQHDVSIHSSINFGKSFLPISCICKGIFTFFCFPDTGLYLLNGFDHLDFFFILMAWQWKPAISVSQTATRGSFFRMLFTNSFCRCCYEHDICYNKLRQKETCGKSYNVVQLYLIPYLRKGCSGCGKYAPWSNCNKAVKYNRCATYMATALQYKMSWTYSESNALISNTSVSNP